MLNVVQTAAVPTATVIFYGTLPPDERTRWVCLLDWNCIKERGKKGKRAQLSLKWELFRGCLAWTDERVNLIWQHTQQWVMTLKNPLPPVPSYSFSLTLSFFFLKHGLICCTASAALGLVCLHCLRGSLLLAVCVRLGKHVLGIRANPSRASHWNVSPLRRCSARYQVEGFHFLSLWEGSWPKGTISLLAPGGLSMQPNGDTTCSPQLPDGATLCTVEGCVCVCACVSMYHVKNKEVLISLA